MEATSGSKKICLEKIDYDGMTLDWSLTPSSLTLQHCSSICLCIVVCHLVSEALAVMPVTVGGVAHCPNDTFQVLT